VKGSPPRHQRLAGAPWYHSAPGHFASHQVRVHRS
jgi:hypothetical protein